MSALLEFDLQSSAFEDNPYETYERIHKDDIVFFDPKIKAYFVGRNVDVRKILTSRECSTEPFADRAEPIAGDKVLVQMEGNEHKEKRSSLLSILTSSMFYERYTKDIKVIIDSLMAPYLEVGEIDLVNDFGKKYALYVTLGILGLPVDRYEDIREWTARMADFATQFGMDEQEKEFCLLCSQKLRLYLEPFVKNSLRTSDDSVLSILWRKRVGERAVRLSEAISMTVNILLAATEPSDKTLSLMFRQLLDKQDVYKKLLLDRSLLSEAIDETLRLTPPVHLIPRKAVAAVELSNITLSPGDNVFCMIGAANRDPSIFSCPNEFQLERKMSDKNASLGKMAAHLSFGLGMHACVGSAFALMQAQYAANLLLDMMPNMKFAPGFCYKERGIYLRGPVSLKIQFGSSPNLRG